MTDFFLLAVAVFAAAALARMLTRNWRANADEDEADAEP